MIQELFLSTCYVFVDWIFSSFHPDSICILKSAGLCHTLLNDTRSDFHCIRTTIQNNETRCERCVSWCLQRDHCAKMISLLFLISQRVQAHSCKRDILIKPSPSVQLPGWDNGGVFMFCGHGTQRDRWTSSGLLIPIMLDQATHLDIPAHRRTILARVCVCVCVRSYSNDINVILQYTIGEKLYMCFWTIGANHPLVIIHLTTAQHKIPRI